LARLAGLNSAIPRFAIAPDVQTLVSEWRVVEAFIT